MNIRLPHRRLLNHMEYVTRVHRWARDRGLATTEDPVGQSFKLVEEVGELAFADTTDDIKDAVGDAHVVIIIKCMQEDLNYGDIYLRGHERATTLSAYNEAALIRNLLGQLGIFADRTLKTSRYSAEDLTEPLIEIVAILENIATNNMLDSTVALGYAWNEIKDRKGKLNDANVFEKEE